MVDLLHADALQQLEVALLVLSVTNIIDLLMAGLPQPQLTSIPTVVQPPQAYTFGTSSPSHSN